MDMTRGKLGGRFVTSMMLTLGCSSSTTSSPVDATVDLGSVMSDVLPHDVAPPMDAPAPEASVGTDARVEAGPTEAAVGEAGVDVPTVPSTCGTALALVPGVTTFVNNIDSLDRDPGCGGHLGSAVRWFRVDAAAGTPMRFSVSGLWLAGNAHLRVLADCGASECLALGGSPIEATTVSTIFVMPAGGHALLSVEGGRSGNDYAYGVEVRPLGTRAPDRCEAAAPLVDGTIVAGQTTFGSTGTTPACGSAMALDAPAAWYAAEVPAWSTLSVSIHGRGELRLFDGCDAARCLATARPLLSYGTLSWTNASAAPVSVRLGVSGPASYDPAVFTLRAALTRTPAAPTCDDPLPARDGFSLLGVDPSTSPDRAVPCGAATAAVPVRSYAIEVPAATTLRVHAFGSAGASRPFVRLSTGCADAACLAPDVPEESRADAWWTNTSTVARTVLVQTGWRIGAADERIALSFELRPVEANTTCAGAVPLADGARVEGVSSFGHRLSSPSVCASGSRFYAVRVGAGDELLARTARVGPPWGYAPGMSLAEGCAATACLARSIATSYGTSDQQLAWVNRTGAARDVVLSVYGDPRETPAGSFDLSVRLRRPAYALTRIPSACDATDAATAVPYVSGATLPLPIAFRYFGEVMTSWTPGFHGTLRLWAGPTGGVTSMMDPVALPSTFVPSRTIAPFWDRFRADSSTPLYWRVVEGPARHLTVAWPSFPFLDADERVTFQAKLFEASGVIEFHYCDVRGATRASGLTASVGLQGVTGLEGVGVSFRAASIDATTAFRFTPTE